MPSMTPPQMSPEPISFSSSHKSWIVGGLSALIMLLIVVGTIVYRNRENRLVTPSSGPIPQIEMKPILETALLAHPWMALIPETESEEPVTTVFLPHRYFLLSKTGAVEDQGYLEVDELAKIFTLRNANGSVSFQIIRMNETELVAQATLVSTFATTVWPSAIVFTAQSLPTLPIPKTIQEAAMWGDSIAVDGFLAKGANIDAQDEFGATILMYAARSFHPELVRYLLDKGANPSLQTLNQKNALHLAAEVGNWPAVQALLAKGADVNLKTGTGITSLYLAVNKNSLSTVKVLVEAGSDVNAGDKDGYTPLMQAVSAAPGGEMGTYRDNIDMLTYLLDHGADINAKNVLGETALSQAIGLQILETTKFLIQRGADTTITVRGLTMREYLHDPINELSPDFIQQVEPLLK